MKVIRTPEQTMLAELYAIGNGLLMRYANLAADGAGPIATELHTIIDRRTPLLSRLTAAEQARDDLPDAGDQEINEIRSAIDSLAGILLGEESARQRLVAAEREWAEKLQRAMSLDWNAAENRLLQDLREDSTAALSALSV